MKELKTNYTFDSSEKTITFNDLPSVLLERVLLITNVTTGVIVYNFADTTKGGTVSGNILTLEYDTTPMSDYDKLQIHYDDDQARIRTITEGLTGLQIYSNAYEDFTASINNGTKTITLSQYANSVLSTFVSGRNLAGCVIYKKPNGTSRWDLLSYTAISFSSDVITLSGIENFITGDEVVIRVTGPMKGYDPAKNAFNTSEQNILGDVSKNLMGTVRKPVNSPTYDLVKYRKYGTTAKEVVIAAAVSIMEWEIENKSDIDLFFQVHDTASLPNVGAVPVFSRKIPADTIRLSPPDFFHRVGSGLTFVISTTEGTYTEYAVVADLSIYIGYAV